jgi:hypothetical protein
MGRLNESVLIQDLPPEERDTQVALLDEPWIGDEGPLDAVFRRGWTGEPLRSRGIAFDLHTTVVWDEAGVQVLRAAEARPEVTALQSPVILRDRFVQPPQLSRVDYLERGCLLGSRYVPGLSSGQGANGHA